MTVRRKVFLLLGGALVCVAGIVGLAIHPGAATIETYANGADILFQADRRWVVQEGDCLTVRWRLEGIQEMYLNGLGSSGAGEQQVCIDDPPDTFTFEVHFVDDTVRDYVLEVGAMVYAPEIWLLALGALTLLIAAAGAGIGPVVARTPLYRRVTPTLRAVRRWAVILGISLLAALLVLELGLRYYFSAYGTEAQRTKYLYGDAELQRQAVLSALPFLNYGLSPAGGNALGYRGPEIAIPKPDGVFRIVVLGDSTVYGLGLPADLAWPAQLQTILRDEYGYTGVEVVNAGVAGYTTWNSVVNFAFRVTELEPDLVLVYHTLSEIGARQLDPACYRGLNRYRGLYPEAPVVQLRDQVPDWSVLYRFAAITLGWLDAPAPDENYQVMADCVDDPAPPPEEALAANPPVYFERNLRDMGGIASAQGVPVMFIAWPYDSTQEHPDWWKAAVAEHNTITRQVAADMDALFLDLSADPIRGDPDNWGGDGVHPSAQGCRVMAGRYAAYLAETGLLPAAADP